MLYDDWLHRKQKWRRAHAKHMAWQQLFFVFIFNCTHSCFEIPCDPGVKSSKGGNPEMETTVLSLKERGKQDVGWYQVRRIK